MPTKKLACCELGQDLIYWEEGDIDGRFVDHTGQSSPCWCLCMGHQEVSIPIKACPFCGRHIHIEDEHPDPDNGCPCAVCVEARVGRRKRGDSL